MRNNNYSPLRYPGGKSRLIGFMKAVIESNGLKGGTYIEPFSGGAAIALALAIEGYMQHVVINDFDRSIYAFWHSILHETNAFIAKIKGTPLTIDEWQRQREIQRNKSEADLLDLGFSSFFLNRTNRSGILKAGVIGGLRQDGVYRMDARYDKNVLIERIQLIAQNRDKFSLYNDDALDLLHRYKDIERRNLIYLDPPYYIKGQQLYVNFFKESDHIALSKVVQKQRKMNVIVTYDNHEAIRRLYPKMQSLTYDLSYSVGATKSGTELLFYKNNIDILDATAFLQVV